GARLTAVVHLNREALGRRCARTVDGCRTSKCRVGIRSARAGIDDERKPERGRLNAHVRSTVAVVQVPTGCRTSTLELHAESEVSFPTHRGATGADIDQ